MERTISSDLLFQNSSEETRTSFPLRVISNLMLWQRRIASRHQLARLAARLPADAGIREAQRCAALSKPFWR